MGSLLFWLVCLIGLFRVGFLPWEVAFHLHRFAIAWLILLFLLTLSLLVVEFLTGFGLWFDDRVASRWRGRALVAALLLAMAASWQGHQPPEVSSEEVTLPGLPPRLDGLVVVALSDLHVGGGTDVHWLTERVEQVAALRPDLILLLGDLIDGDPDAIEGLLPAFSGFSAPLGVWAVTGNHEFISFLDGKLRLLEAAGGRWLRDRSVEVAPGLVLTGIDDRWKKVPGLLGGVLGARPAGASILLSHRPDEVPVAVDGGVGLMLSGHTHGGQVWPFGLAVKVIFPYLEGRYTEAGTTILVSRGAGVWGARMRLWRPGNLLKVTLRAPPGG
ncbi:MAG: metallophosphoesterase [Magnetococcales bacterium]|nr:metallophosphoesterase [Magnetococcales bacterium]